METYKKLVAAKRVQDLIVFKAFSKMKKFQKRKRIRQIKLSKYLRAKIFKWKLIGFTDEKTLRCKGYYIFNKLHKKIAFRQPNLPNTCIKSQKKALKAKKKAQYPLSKHDTVGLIVCVPIIIEPRQVEVTRRILSRTFKKIIKKSNLWKYNFHPNQSITRKGIGTRMGTGKGRVRTWVHKAITGKTMLFLKNIKRIKYPRCLLSSIKKSLPYKTAIAWQKNYFFSDIQNVW